MKKLVTSTSIAFGPHETIEALSEGYKAGDFFYPFAVTGNDATIEDWTEADQTAHDAANAPSTSVPQEVTMRQARLALLDAGLLSSIQPAIDSMTSPDKERAQIEWEYSSTVLRRNSFVSSLGLMLNLSESALDNLFIVAINK